jgi:CHAD domain-containing protein
MQASFAHPTGLAFHRWRIRVKHLYYQLEWLEPVRPKRFAAMLKRLHRLEEKLGADHDLAVSGRC